MDHGTFARGGYKNLPSGVQTVLWLDGTKRVRAPAACKGDMDECKRPKCRRKIKQDDLAAALANASRETVEPSSRNDKGREELLRG